MFALRDSRRIRILLQSSILAASVALLSACGSSQGNETTTITSERPSPHSIQHCLERNGAVKAKTVTDLVVLVKAEEKDDISKPGFAYDKKASIVVDVWTGSSFEGQPSPWMLWIGHPFGKELTPEEIVVNKPPKSYVMYVTSSKKRRHAESCLTFSGEAGKNSTEIDLSEHQ